MKSFIFFGFLINLLKCDLTRHSNDVLKRSKIFIEAHRGVSNGQKNHNTKEAILNTISKGVESFETDCWLTKDKKVILSHDGYIQKNSLSKRMNFKDYDWSEFEKIIEEENEIPKIPLLDDIMKITKNKIFMNLEIKDENEEIWEEIKKLIEKYEYYDQISISSFKIKYYDKVVNYNKEKNRNIVFGFLFFDFDIIRGQEPFVKGPDLFELNETNHQITVNAYGVKNNPEFVEEVHDKGMTIGVYFYDEPNNRQYYNLFEVGVDVIITDYPIRVANQLNDYNSNSIELEGCKNVEKK